MITGHIHDRVPNWYPQALKELIAHFQQTDFTNMEEGKYAIKGDDIFFMVSHYETKDAQIAKPEDHQIYADVQFMFAGEEYFGVSLGNEEFKAEAYDGEKDIRFYEPSDKYGQLHFKEGMYIVVMPQDVHVPGLNMPDGIRKVKKVVGKIKYTLLT